MYRRYTNANDPGMTLDQRKRSRLKDVVIILLIIALAALAVVSYPALQSRSGSHDLYVLRMRSECDEAIRLTNTLSRNAGADSAGILARIRSNIYAMTVINVFNNNQEVGNGDLVPTATLETILNTLEKYQTVLITGMDTGEQQTNLLNDLESVRLILEQIE